MAFWDTVEKLRKEQNTSYRWLAQKMGLSETTVSSMRHQGTEPRATEAVRIANALETTVEFLTSENENTFSNSVEYNYQKKYLDLKSALMDIMQKF